MREVLDERFPGRALDRDVWFPYYLPHWSSRAASAATYEVRDGELRLWIPPEQPLWCPDLHEEPMRVSCLQTGNWSGPVGSTRGPQPFADGLVVLEEQPAFWGHTPRYGRIEATVRATVPARSMAAFWLSGTEEVREHSAEICVAEVFGDTVRDGTADVGVGLHKFGNPDVSEDFTTVRLPLDLGRDHTYAVDWAPGSLVFTVDGQVVRRLDQAPDHPVQLMLGVFDFPARAAADETEVPVPELVVSSVRSRPPA
ncbi:glycoside hydrolase family 16 protein [Geodermatophilus marinus]|uniref:glycoside hydrolase family 16 protein n=1 Tax=Geodermatophilus sp. LHW52908 TaxID=2303986 RepID=UPI0018F7CCA7|nr:glycoside hydrolase family 16 protein [Geodermatophilus sp. LHW52908]